MPLTGRKKVALGIIATIVLGGIGSGVWELVFAPIATWVGGFVLTVFTLGLESARSEIYQSVAKGHHELPSLLIYGLLAIMMTVFPVGVALPILTRRRVVQSVRTKSPEQLEAVFKRLRWVLVTLMAIALFLGGSFLARYAMHAYVNKAITHFEQCVRIIGPTLDPSQEREYRSEFASIRTKADFIALMARNQRRGTNS